MRASLNNIERIEQYLLGKLTPSEKEAFELELQTNSTLQEEVALQQELQKTIERKALKNEIKNIRKKQVRARKLKQGVLMVAGAILLTITALWLKANQSVKPVAKKEIKTAIHEPKPERKVNASGQYDFNGLKTWVKPKEQLFPVEVEKGATIEGDDGTLIIVPKNAFIDEEGDPVKGKVNVTLVEALNLEDMVLYNLGTTADGKSLQTGGMLHVDFEQNGKKLQLNPKKPLYVEVPTDKVRKGMQVFEGETKEGKVNWKNPKPLKKYLVNVPFSTLDFYPQGFEEEVAAKLPINGHNNITTALLDSLYYLLPLSMGNDSNPSSLNNETERIDSEFQSSDVTEVKKDTLFPKINTSRPIVQSPDLSKDSKETTIGDLKAQIDSLLAIGASIQDPLAKLIQLKEIKDSIIYTKNKKTRQNCRINPLTIKTIKAKAYARTFVATQPFQERLKVLHQLDNGEKIVQYYLKNIDKNLSDIDARVARRLKGNAQLKFKQFAAQKLGNTKEGALYATRLRKYYTEKMKANQAALKAMYTQLKAASNQKLKQLNQQYRRQLSSYKKVKNRSTNTGRPTAVRKTRGRAVNNVAVRPSYSFTWANSGWVNIDSYLHLLSKGSKSVQINLAGGKGPQQIYQWISQVQNLVPLASKGKGGVAMFPKQNASTLQLAKQTFCFAISKSGEDYFWVAKGYNPYQQDTLSLKMESTTIKVIKNKLAAYSIKNDVLAHYTALEKMAVKAARIRRKRWQDQQKRKRLAIEYRKKYNEIKRKKMEKMRVLNELRQFVFPCVKVEPVEELLEKIEDEDIQMFNSVENKKVESLK